MRLAGGVRAEDAPGLGILSSVSVARFIPVVACLLALTACGSASSTPSATPAATAATTASTSASASASASASVKVSNSLDAITVTGKRLATPKVSFKAPFAIDKTRVKVLVPGTGPKAQASGYVTVSYYGVNGRSGKLFDESYSTKSTATFPLSQVITGFKTGLTGQAVGSRVLIAMPGSDAYDAAGGSSSAGINVGDTLIFVVDLVATSLANPAGTIVTPPAGLPTVTGAASQKPTVTIPSTTAPTKMTAQDLIVGRGAKITKSQTVYARYVGYSWKTGKLVDDQFTTPSAGLLSSTIPGWQKGLVGKTIGSRVLLVLPPAYGYPQGSTKPALEKGDTIVYVVDILFAYSA